MSLLELIPQVLLSPYVIGIVIVIVIYSFIISAASRHRERIPKAPKLKKSAKIKRFKPDKPGLKKGEDISELGLE